MPKEKESQAGRPKPEGGGEVNDASRKEMLRAKTQFGPYGRWVCLASNYGTTELFLVHFSHSQTGTLVTGAFLGTVFFAMEPRAFGCRRPNSNNDHGGGGDDDGINSEPVVRNVCYCREMEPCRSPSLHCTYKRSGCACTLLSNV